MKRLFLACVALVALAGAAAAADLPPRAAPNYYKAPAYVPPYTWSGFYIGVNGGGAWGTSAWDSTSSFNTTGGLVGGTLGYNYQIGQAVLGVEGDVDWAKIQGSNAVAQTSDTWLSTVRGRLGYAADRFMPFVTAGGAFGDIRATPAAPGFAGGSETNAGWTVGAGLEFAVAGNFTLKAEYLYVDLGKFNCGAGCGAATDNVSFTTNIVRAGLNYRF